MEVNSKGKSIRVLESRSSSDKPPLEVRVLVLEHGDKYLSTVETMLTFFGYIVSRCQQAKDALSLLVENKGSYDIVISDTHLPDMDGFKFLEKLGSELDLPVDLILIERQGNSILNGTCHSDRGYLIKPITSESLGQMKEQILLKKENREPAIRVLLVGDDDQLQDQTANNNVLSSDHNHVLQDQNSPAINEADHVNNNSATLKRIKDEENHDQELHDDQASSYDATKTKKPRLVWSPELHHKFITAVEQLGSKNAVPKKILESMQNMGVSNLTRENVASHLQKYRMNIKKTTNQSQTKSLLGLPRMSVGQNYAQGGRFKSIQSYAGPDQLHFPRLTLDPNLDHVAILPAQIGHINSHLDPSSVQAMGPDHHIMTQQFVDHNVDGTVPGYDWTIPVRQANNLQPNETPDQFFWNTNENQYCQLNEIAPSRRIMDEAEIDFQHVGYDGYENVVANTTNSMSINYGAISQPPATSRQYHDFALPNMANSDHPTINSSTNYGNNSFSDNHIGDHIAAGEEYVNLGNNDIGLYHNEPVDGNAYHHHNVVQPEQRSDGDNFMQSPFIR